jgi:ABC-type molybdate transport system permease subunit
MIYSTYSLFGLLVLVLDIIAIASVLTGRSSVERKVLWTVLVLILPVVGMVLYYLIGKNGSDKVAIS